MVTLPLTETLLTAYHNQPNTLVYKAEHNAYNDDACKDHHAVDDSGHGGYTTYMQDKADPKTSTVA
jgi:hypothetical protein